MKRIDPVELSGLIDREMTEERSAEVRQFVANTASLREELESLSRADSRWRAVARSAALQNRYRDLCEAYLLWWDGRSHRRLEGSSGWSRLAPSNNLGGEELADC